MFVPSTGYSRWRKWALYYQVGLVAIACFFVTVPADALAGAPADSDSMAPAAASDPAEGANRAVFTVNHAIDHAAIAPVARVYRGGLPHAVRECFGHFVSNLQEPSIFVNDVLQANPR